MTASKRQQRHSPDGTTRSPADRDIFHDDGPRVPVKDRTPAEQDEASDSSEAGGVN